MNTNFTGNCLNNVLFIHALLKICKQEGRILQQKEPQMTGIAMCKQAKTLKYTPV